MFYLSQLTAQILVSSEETFQWATDCFQPHIATRGQKLVDTFDVPETTFPNILNVKVHRKRC